MTALIQLVLRELRDGILITSLKKLRVRTREDKDSKTGDMKLVLKLCIFPQKWPW